MVTWATAGGIGVVSLNDPQSQNALDGNAVELIERALSELGADPSVKVVIIEGLPEIFCSGGSAEVIRGLAANGREAAALYLLLPRRILNVPVPVIAAMSGHAFGAGLMLGVCADIVLMARESSYGLTFMEYGFTPGMGATRLLEHILSPAVAHELLYTGENRRGSQLEGRSGINYILPRSEVGPKARDLALRIARKSRLSLELLKRTLSAPRRQDFETAQNIEHLMQHVTLLDPLAAERIEAALSSHGFVRSPAKGETP